MSGVNEELVTTIAQEFKEYFDRIHVQPGPTGQQIALPSSLDGRGPEMVEQVNAVHETLAGQVGLEVSGRSVWHPQGGAPATYWYAAEGMTAEELQQSLQEMAEFVANMGPEELSTVIEQAGAHYEEAINAKAARLEEAERYAEQQYGGLEIGDDRPLLTGGGTGIFLRGFANLEQDGSLVAVISNSSTGNSFFMNETALSKILEKDGIDPGARAVYNGALEGMHEIMSNCAAPDLQTISQVNDFVLPGGQRLGDTPEGNQPENEDFGLREAERKMMPGFGP